jgi:hypothetical protein
MLLNNYRSRRIKSELELNVSVSSPRKCNRIKSRNVRAGSALRLRKAEMKKFNREKLALLLEEVRSRPPTILN